MNNFEVVGSNMGFNAVQGFVKWGIGKEENDAEDDHNILVVEWNWQKSEPNFRRG